MAKGDQKAKPRQTNSTPDRASPEQADALQGRYGSGGSYGVGGGFDDDEGRESVPDKPDEPAGRTARSEAQQDGEQIMGFEREVDLDAPPRALEDTTRTAEEDQLAAKNRRGSRL